MTPLERKTIRSLPRPSSSAVAVPVVFAERDCDDPLSPELVLVCPELARLPLAAQPEVEAALDPKLERPSIRRAPSRRHVSGGRSRFRRNALRTGLALPIVGALAFAFALAPRPARPRPLLLTETELFGAAPAVRQVQAAAKSDGVFVTWRVAPDARRVTVTLWRNEPRRNLQLLYRGFARSFLDRTAKPGTRYRYTVEATDSPKQQEVDIRTP